MIDFAPSTLAAFSASTSLIALYSAGESFGWPFSPGVIWTMTARQPASTCLSTDAPPMISASAACAPMTMMHLSEFDSAAIYFSLNW